MSEYSSSVAGRLMAASLEGPLPRVLLFLSLIAGLLALQFTPREEEPQIVVPMVDILIHAPGLSANQVERQVITPVEKMLSQIPGVEHIYSTSQSGVGMVTLRFFVGEDREDSLLNTYNKLFSNQDSVPAVVSDWIVKPVEVDDVPILMLTLWSDDHELYDDHSLRRIAEELSTYLQGTPQTSEVNVIGGRDRRIQVLIDPAAMAAHQTTIQDVAFALKVSNQLQVAGQITFNNRNITLEGGDALSSVEQMKQLVVNVIDGIPVYLQDVSSIIDGPAPHENYTWLDLAPGHEDFDSSPRDNPMVVISIAKQPGTNAVWVSRDIKQKFAELSEELLPGNIHLEILRDYGETADAKVNNLTGSLVFAILTVVVFVGLFLGWRSALVVGIAIPICYGATLALDYAFGYTINRVTLFALILSLGLLVDDPITGIDNIDRYLKNSDGDLNQRIIEAIFEIRIPLLMSTLTIVLAFVPLAFITGMMGPYMAPMSFNVPVSVVTSTIVAFMVTPWLATKFLRPESKAQQKPAAVEKPLISRIYQILLESFLDNRQRAKRLLYVVLSLFILAALLPLFRAVPLKLLPFDNKSEIQILIDLQEGSSLEQTAAVAKKISSRLTRFAEVRSIGVFVGIPSPMDFNGMVRRYYNRTAPHQADLRVKLVAAETREHQSHAIVLRMREALQEFNTDQVKIKVIEVPPGPPVLSTLTAEIYGDTLTPYPLLRDAARTVEKRLEHEAHVVEIDSTVEHLPELWRFIVDKPKAALSGIATEDINTTLLAVNAGLVTGHLNINSEANPLPIQLRLKESERSEQRHFELLQVQGRPGFARVESDHGLDAAPQALVSIGELGRFQSLPADAMIHHKDLRPVVYVTADISGRTPASIIADMNADMTENILQTKPHSTHWKDRNYINPGGGIPWGMPEGSYIEWGGEGEWRITIRVFRDMGLAFAFALLAIFFVLRFQTASTSLSLIIMSAIPLTIIGIMPGFWLLNQLGERQVAGAPDPILFTATAMIGMIALAGIVVRNSLIMVEFIVQLQNKGVAIKESLVQAGAIRLRPILLTAGTTLLGNLVIILDPVFSGLAWAIIFGIISSTGFTLFVVPVVYFLVFSPSESGEEVQA
jgi:multidrug efflux pump subunit AcrB